MNEAMEQIRQVVIRQVGDTESVGVVADPAGLVRFSPDLPGELTAEERSELIARARSLEPWLQGPFLLGGDLVVGGVWRIDSRWANLDDELPDDLGGISVLDVGSNAGYDPFMFKLRGAGKVMAAEPFEFIEQALFLESIYRSGVDFQRLGWQELNPEHHGRFDLVHCHGVLYHEVDPMALLQRLNKMTVPGGTLLVGSMMLADPLFADTARFVPRAYFNDETWWWVPGPVAFRRMIETAGFEVVGNFGVSPGPDGEFATVNGYFRATKPS